jgi:hypothetical protein
MQMPGPFINRCRRQNLHPPGCEALRALPLAAGLQKLAALVRCLPPLGKTQNGHTSLRTSPNPEGGMLSLSDRVVTGSNSDKALQPGNRVG